MFPSGVQVMLLLQSPFQGDKSVAETLMKKYNIDIQGNQLQVSVSNGQVEQPTLPPLAVEVLSSSKYLELEFCNRRFHINPIKNQ
jgi:hypothetical protein